MDYLERLARTSFCSMGLSLMPLSASASDPLYQESLTAYQAGNQEKAFSLMKQSAEKGNARSQYLLCTYYRRGIGVDHDEYKAFYWCKKAAEEEVLEAQFHLGLMYLQGEGVTDDSREALRWLWRAAERGYPEASKVVQFIYSDDFGIGC